MCLGNKQGWGAQNKHLPESGGIKSLACESWAGVCCCASKRCGGEASPGAPLRESSLCSA